MFFRLLIAFFTVFVLCCTAVFADETKPADSTKAKTQKAKTFSLSLDHRLSFLALALPHRSLRNSESLHSWPFFVFATPLGWTSELKMKKDLGNLFAFKGMAAGDMTIFSAGLRADASLEVLHLLEVGVQGFTNSAINYGSYATFMGVYNSEKKKFDTDYFLTEFMYGARYHASLTIPLLVFLPKSAWTKIIVKPEASLIYRAYTGADDGEAWKVGNEVSANGYAYHFGGTLIYMLPFEHFPMAMVSYYVRGICDEEDFDEVYAPYDPGFKSIGFTPMLSVKLNDKWNGMLMATFTRARTFKNYRYEANEELLQERNGHEWTMTSVMFILNRKF